MTYPKIPLAQTVVQLCKAKNIKHIVISPGSRNAPLTIGFTNDPFFNCYSIVDERCAAFFALGIAQQIQEPTAVVCTSGSALLNYYPAVAEAFFSDIPLIVLSADRPKHLVGIGDGQTINQKYIFENHVLYSANLKLDLKEDKNSQEEEELPIFKNLENKFEWFLGLQKDIQTHNEEDINKAINLARIQNGPVHINVPFDEPLYETVETLSVAPQANEAQVKPDSIKDDVLQPCLEAWNTASKIMVLVGVNAPNTIEQKWLDALADNDHVIVLTETTSNIHHPSFFPSIDTLIAPLKEDEKKQLQPDILLTFGGLVVSKKVKQFLRKHQPKHHWHIDVKMANDTFFCLNQHIKNTPNQFFEKFLPSVKHLDKSDYKSTWTAVKQHRQEKHKAYIKTIPFSDFTVFNSVLKSIPEDYILQSGNSSAIRYTQLFKIDKSINVFCNRGTSGIDGSTSTAIGCAVAQDKPTVFITGDLSFFYDSNALWNNYIPKDFRIIIVNNQGGGIFRILPGHKNTENFDTYFETNHHLTAEHVCKMYGLEYQSVSDEVDLMSVLKTFYSEGERPSVLEVFTPNRINDGVLLDYFEYIK